MNGKRKLTVAIIAILASVFMFIAMCYYLPSIDPGVLTIFFTGFFGMIAIFYGANAVGDHSAFKKN